MSRFLLLFLALFSNLSFADAGAYGGRHEIAIDGINGSIRHVHNWNTNKNKELFLDFHNHDKFFSPLNDFSYVEYIDRWGEVRFRYPSPAYTKLWSYRDQIFVGMSNIKLNNPYQLVVWKWDGTIIYKAHFSYRIAEFTSEKLIEFKDKYPEDHKLLQARYFDYNNITYCGFLRSGIGQEASKFLHSISKPHPYMHISESTSNWVKWMGDKDPEVDKDGNLIIYPNKGTPIVIKIR